MAKRRIPADPEPKRISRPSRKGGTERSRRTNRDRGYLADLDEEEYDDRDRGRAPRQRKSDATVPIIMGVCAVLAILAAIIFFQNPQLWDSEMKAARYTVSNTEDINAMMVAMEKLIAKNDIAGLRMARNHFVKMIQKLPTETGEKWKTSVGDKLLGWASAYDHETRDVIQSWTRKDSKTWVGNTDEYKQVMRELEAEAIKFEQVCNLQWFKETIMPKLNMSDMPPMKGRDNRMWTVDETVTEFKKSLHLHFTTVKLNAREYYYYENKNPTIRGNFTINDETFFYVIKINMLMEKLEDGSYKLKDASLVKNSE